MNIDEVLKPILENFNVEKYNFRQKNKIGKLFIVINKEWEPSPKKDIALVEAVKSLPIIHLFRFDAMRGGKKIENKNFYNFEFSLKKEFYDGTIELNDHYGVFLKLVQEKNIKSKEDLYRVTIGMIKNMSDYTHTLKFKEKRKYRETKLAYIENLYKLGYIESVAEQISYSKDSLILFKTKFGYDFHLRKDDCYFLPKNNLTLLPNLYMKREIDFDNINMEFQDYYPILNKTENEFMLQNAEII